MTVAAVRIDSRLVHGQVVETWLPALKADAVVVVDEDTAGNGLAQSAMRLALPPNVSLTVLRPDADLSAKINAGERTLVLVPSVEVAAHLIGELGRRSNGLLINVGVVHEEAGKRQITQGVHLSTEEIDLLAGLSDCGVRVEVRELPSHNPLAVEDARARFLRQGPNGRT